MEKKTCNKCNLELSVELFGKQSARKDGLFPWCKQCCKKYNHENKEKKSIQDKLYRQKNKTELAIKRKNKYNENPTKFKESYNKCINKHPKKRIETCKKYQDKYSKIISEKHKVYYKETIEIRKSVENL